MRFLLIDKDQSPDFMKGDRAAITGYFMDIRSATTAGLVEVRRRKHVAGVYANPSWDGWRLLRPDQLAERVFAAFLRLNVPALRLQWDIETHEPDFVAQVLHATRDRLPTVGMSWTLEPNQGGWFTPELVSAIIHTRTRVVVQLYNGAMRVHYDSWGQVERLISRGIPAAQVSPFYDAEILPAGWDGYAFAQGRLP